jgi:hypothetical protein
MSIVDESTASSHLVLGVTNDKQNDVENVVTSNLRVQMLGPQQTRRIAAAVHNPGAPSH